MSLHLPHTSCRENNWRSRCLRRLLLIPFLMFFAVAASSPAVAQTEPPAPLALLEVLAVGWNTQVVPGSWSPVRLQVTAGPRALSGEVEVVVRGFTTYARTPSAQIGSSGRWPVAY